jgi:hypothetical protein
MSYPTAAASLWPRRFHDLVVREPLTVLAQLESAFDEAQQSGERDLQMAVAANALAFMLVDWGRFSRWRVWIERFEINAKMLAPLNDKDLCLMRDTGAVACALLRGEPLDALTSHGLALLPRMNDTIDVAASASQFALAARVLLPWLQMSRDIAGAQALHAQMTAIWNTWAPRDGAAAHWWGTWLLEWAQHLSFVERGRLPHAMHEIDQFLETYSHVTLPFGLARLKTETAFHDMAIERAAKGVEAMLSALRPGRPLERVAYNSMAATLSRNRNDIDTAKVHIEYMKRDLEDADCPPSIAMVYRIRETGIHLFSGEYDRAAAVFDECAAYAFTAHASVIRGYGSLARALHAHRMLDCDASQNALLRDELHAGLAAMRKMPVTSFFVAVKEARSSVCALALRENIETQFVLEALKQIPTSPPDWADEHWPWALSLRCFGGFESTTRFAQGQGASKSTSRPLHLLMLIAAYGERGVTVSDATHCLWPDQDGDQAENSLSTTLLRLRRLYAGDDLILRDHGWLKLNAEKTWTDVRAIEALLDRLSGESLQSSEQSTIRDAKRLFDLYRGDCLRGVEDHWVDARARHFRARVSLVARRMIRECTQREYRDALDVILTHARERELDIGEHVYESR